MVYYARELDEEIGDSGGGGGGVATKCENDLYLCLFVCEMMMMMATQDAKENEMSEGAHVCAVVLEY